MELSAISKIPADREKCRQISYTTASTFATVIVDSDNIGLASDSFPGLVFSKYTDGVNVFHLTSGHFFNDQLDYIANEAKWSKVIRFGSLGRTLGDEGLTSYVDPKELDVKQ